MEYFVMLAGMLTTLIIGYRLAVSDAKSGKLRDEGIYYDYFATPRHRLRRAIVSKR